MTWSIHWDRHDGNGFSSDLGPFLHNN